MGPDRRPDPRAVRRARLTPTATSRGRSTPGGAGARSSSVVSRPWPGSTRWSAGSVNRRRSIDSMIWSKFAPGVAVLPGPPGNSVSPLNTHRLALEQEARRPGGVPGRVDGAQPQVADLDHVVVGDHEVVRRAASRRRLASDPDVDAGVAHGVDGLDVVPVTVRRQDPPHARGPAHLEEQVVLVGGVEQRASPVCLLRSMNTLFSNGPTVSLSIRTSAVSKWAGRFTRCRVPAPWQLDRAVQYRPWLDGLPRHARGGGVPRRGAHVAGRAPRGRVRRGRRGRRASRRDRLGPAGRMGEAARARPLGRARLARGVRRARTRPSPSRSSSTRSTRRRTRRPA